RSGATAVGARDFLIAVNFNLNTTSTRRANAIAFDVREKGRPKREGGKPNGKPLKDADGNVIMLPGTLKGTKAIGWFIDEYGIAQVSMNITDIAATPLHVAFDEVCRAAAARGEEQCDEQRGKEKREFAFHRNSSKKKGAAFYNPFFDFPIYICR
nr:hypothetical protein [Schwartzia sp. (in: firmicutes)]